MSKFIAFVLLAIIANGVLLASPAALSSSPSTQPIAWNSPSNNLFAHPYHPVASATPPSPTQMEIPFPRGAGLQSTPFPTTQDLAAAGESAISHRVPSIATVVVAPAATRGPRHTPPPKAITLEEFAKSIYTGRPDVVVGVYVPGILALRVAQQPGAGSSYIYPMEGYATQFELAARFGTVALLAHNYLAGALFFQLTPGEPAYLVYGDSSIRRFSISRSRHLQALRPDDPFSTFLDLDNGHDSVTSDQLFRQIYMDPGHVIFQTCIKRNGNSSWGRLFVIAAPL